MLLSNLHIHTLSTIITFQHILIYAQQKGNPSFTKRKCFQCTMPFKCNLGLCFGDYCIKSLANKQYVSKGCGNNTFRLVNGESYYIQESSEYIEKSHCLTEHMFGVENIICYCNNFDFCNGSGNKAENIAILSFFVILFNLIF